MNVKPLNRERGATAIIVAVVLLVLVGFGALAVDVGILMSDRKQVQNGADAAALAIAQECAEGSTCDSSIAAGYVAGNKLDANAAPASVDIDPTAGRVTVVATTSRALSLANVLGFASADVKAEATASWGVIGGAETIPITMAKCAFNKAVLDDSSKWVHLVTKDPGGVGDGEDPCGSSSTPHVVPGGFHWLMPDSGCQVATDVGDEAPSSPGNTNPKSCDEDTLNDLLRGDTVLIPMFDMAYGNGAGAKYRLVGYAEFRTTAYCLTNKVEWLTGAKPVTGTDITKCTGSERWIQGYYLRTVSLDAVLNPTATDFGSFAVQLTIKDRTP